MVVFKPPSKVDKNHIFFNQKNQIFFI